MLSLYGKGWAAPHDNDDNNNDNNDAADNNTNSNSNKSARGGELTDPEVDLTKGLFDDLGVQDYSNAAI